MRLSIPCNSGKDIRTYRRPIALSCKGIYTRNQYDSVPSVRPARISALSFAGSVVHSAFISARDIPKYSRTSLRGEGAGISLPLSVNGIAGPDFIPAALRARFPTVFDSGISVVMRSGTSVRLSTDLFEIGNSLFGIPGIPVHPCDDSHNHSDCREDRSADDCGNDYGLSHAMPHTICRPAA